MTIIRLAHVPGAQGDNTLLENDQRERALSGSCKLDGNGPLPSLLISYVYIESWRAVCQNTLHRDWVLDSGAFTAKNSGIEIKLDQYIDTVKQLRDSDAKLVEVFALDVIGDWKGTRRNVEAMWRAGVEAIPCFHIGEPWDVLIGYARDYPKVALGGMVFYPTATKVRWIEQCFARIWPKRVHGFGAVTPRVLEAAPFWSVDATSWELRPCKFGTWQAFGGTNLGIRGSLQNLRSEVEHYLKLERRYSERWAKELAQLG